MTTDVERDRLDQRPGQSVSLRCYAAWSCVFRTAATESLGFANRFLDPPKRLGQIDMANRSFKQRVASLVSDSHPNGQIEFEASTTKFCAPKLDCELRQVGASITGRRLTVCDPAVPPADHRTTDLRAGMSVASQLVRIRSASVWPRPATRRQSVRRAKRVPESVRKGFAVHGSAERGPCNGTRGAGQAAKRSNSRRNSHARPIDHGQIAESRFLAGCFRSTWRVRARRGCRSLETWAVIAGIYGGRRR